MSERVLRLGGGMGSALGRHRYVGLAKDGTGTWVPRGRWGFRVGALRRTLRSGWRLRADAIEVTWREGAGE